ncbi:hypothetical protein FRB95_001865 [Tulasnella sp. JGI-2019a]|nr:hypothetical protein FRB95_001865 [Tulasnella sp. JGI-2019a]
MDPIATQTQDVEHPSQTLAPSLPTVNAPDLRSTFVENIANRGIDPEADSYIARLTFLGQEIINICVAAALFENQDIPTSGYLQNWHEVYTGSYTLSQWSTLYHDSEAYLIGVVSEEPAHLAELFAAYVGVIYQQDGIRVAQSWIEVLVKFTNAKVAMHDDTARPAKHERPCSQLDDFGYNVTSLKRTRFQPDASFSTCSSPTREPTSTSYQVSSLTACTPAPTPVLTSTMVVDPFVFSSAPLPKHGQIVSVLHERAAKKGLKLNWSFSQNGTAHNSEWHANLSIPEIGLDTLGIHRTKQGAKEEAAKSAVTGPNALL